MKLSKFLRVDFYSFFALPRMQIVCNKCVSKDLRTFISRLLILFKCDSQRRFKEEKHVMNRGKEIHNVSYSVYTCVIYLHIMGKVYNMKIMLGDTIKIKMIYYILSVIK